MKFSQWFFFLPFNLTSNRVWCPCCLITLVHFEKFLDGDGNPDPNDFSRVLQIMELLYLREKLEKAQSSNYERYQFSIFVGRYNLEFNILQRVAAERRHQPTSLSKNDQEYTEYVCDVLKIYLMIISTSMVQFAQSLFIK